MKKVLVIHYSQTGQLDRVAERFAQPLVDSPDVEVTFAALKPVEPFPFPWPFLRFVDTFPECVYLDPPPIHPLEIDTSERYDLIVLAYQIWFLSPALPATAFMQSDAARRLLANTPVVTLIACRNMWLMAQEEMKRLLADAGARLVGNVVLVDEAGSIWSFLATPLWVLTGKKGPLLGGKIPRAGVAEHEIEACDRFGERILERLRASAPLDGGLLQGLGAVHIDEKLISSERAARRGFRIWGKLIRSVGPPRSHRRKPILIIWFAFLVTFILTFVPISMLVKKLLAPLTARRTTEQKQYFSQPSGVAPADPTQ
jgi:hypothetical protein